LRGRSIDFIEPKRRHAEFRPQVSWIFMTWLRCGPPGNHRFSSDDRICLVRLDGLVV